VLIFLVISLNAFACHFQVILEVAPESLYNEMFNKVFKNSLFELSVDRCANFVIQALISHARDQEQVSLSYTSSFSVTSKFHSRSS
jgi:nucleolar protein 9